MNNSNLKPSYFDGYSYVGYQVKTSLVREGYGEYAPFKIFSPLDVYNRFKKMIDADRERFYSIFLDNRNNVIGVDMVSQGCIDSTLVHPREVFKPAILCSAVAIIFVHHHTGGNPNPSNDDIQTTNRLKWAADILGISVVDHVIIGIDDYYSFQLKGLLPKTGYEKYKPEKLT